MTVLSTIGQILINSVCIPFIGLDYSLVRWIPTRQILRSTVSIIEIDQGTAMSDRPTSPKQAASSKPNGHTDIEPQEPQPESGFIDREERLSIQQSSPTNPRVADKSEENQEEA